MSWYEGWCAVFLVLDCGTVMQKGNLPRPAAEQEALAGSKIGERSLFVEQHKEAWDGNGVQEKEND